MGERAPARPEPLRRVPAWRVRALAVFWVAARVVCAGGGGDRAAGGSGGLRVRDAGEVGVRACMRFEWLGAGRWGWQAAPDFVVAAGFSAFARLGAGGPATLGRVTVTDGAGVNRLARSGERRRGRRSRARVRASQAMDISRDGERCILSKSTLSGGQVASDWRLVVGGLGRVAVGVGGQLRGRLRVWRVAGVLDRVCCRTCGWLRWWGETAPGVAGADKGGNASHALRGWVDCMAREAGRGGDGKDALTAALGVIGNPSNWGTKPADSTSIK